MRLPPLYHYYHLHPLHTSNNDHDDHGEADHDWSCMARVNATIAMGRVS